MAANASTNAEHIDLLDTDSVTNAVASLATLFEKSESGAELNLIERDELAKRFELQLTQIAGTLDASSFGQFHLHFTILHTLCRSSAPPHTKVCVRCFTNGGG